MKKNIMVFISALFLLSAMLGACTRSASGGPSDVVTDKDALPNPVSTQSQIMKDIIAGTQTAMAVPVDATPAEGKEAPVDDDDDAASETTPEPIQVEPTAKPLPTSTAGPPPVVELDYNAKTCAPGLFICVLENTKDQTVTVQGSYPWLFDNTDIKFTMGPGDSFDFGNYIVAGTSTYKPDTSKGYGFRVVLMIPDSLRGTAEIVVRLEAEDGKWGSDFFANK